MNYKWFIVLITLFPIFASINAQLKINKAKKITLKSPLTVATSRNYLAYSPHGYIGIAYHKAIRGRKGANVLITALKYSEITPEGKFYSEIVTSQRISRSSPITISLVYDIHGAPHILRLYIRHYEHWFKKNGKWHKEKLDLDWKALVGYKLPVHYGALRGADGKIHLFFSAKKGEFVHGVLEGTKWYFETSNPMDTGDIRKVFNLQMDSKGHIHVVYSLDRHLYYAKRDKDSWHKEAVLLRKNFDSEPAWNAWLALDKQGTPFIASTYIQRVNTGSFRYAYLKFHRRKNGRWQNKTLAKKSGGYYGKDGDRFTGDYPYLVIDSENTPHIIFTDIASWHGNSGNDYAMGQLRYTYYNGSKWKYQTIYKQTGQARQKKPLEEFLHPVMIISPGLFEFVGMEKITKNTTSLYVDPDKVHIDYRLLYINAKKR